MFTGLVAAVGTVTRVHIDGLESDLEVDLEGLPETLRIGDSVALSGVCCTIVSQGGTQALFHLGEETLKRTWLGSAVPGTLVNLEGALRAGDPLGGHLVQGHVDGVGRVQTVIDPLHGGEWRVRLAEGLGRYAVEKGSITLDGVSLTVAAVEGDEVVLWIIPHTAKVTTLGRLRPGDPLHVEVDILAKYVEKLLAPGHTATLSRPRPQTPG